MKDEFMKKGAHLRGGAVHAFRMPLYAYCERMRGYFYGFDSVVLCSGCYGHTFSGPVYGLMMKAVYIKGRSDISPEQRAALDADVVAHLAPGSGLLHMIKGFTGDKGHVLPDTSSAGYAHDLHAPADGKDRLLRGENLFHKPDLKQIYSNVSLSVSVFRFFSKEQRCDVPASTEQESITEPDIFFEDMVAADQRKDNRYASGVADRLNVGIGYKLAVFRKTAHDDSDNRFHSALLYGLKISLYSVILDIKACQNSSLLKAYVKNWKAIHGKI